MNDEGIRIDCRQCLLRGISCSDCVVSVLIGAPRPVEWDEVELRAVDNLAEAGLVPKLRLTPASAPPRSKAA